MLVLTLPIWITMLVHDAVISNARCYSERELLQLAELAETAVNRDKGKDCEPLYEWKCWTQSANMLFPFGLLLTVTVLFGRPRQKML